MQNCSRKEEVWVRWTETVRAVHFGGDPPENRKKWGVSVHSPF